ncbi:MAG: hypothetical protein MUC38_14245 [Cyclobacteriaceae bacterium]|jgi:exosortase F-associated protein|nr:hypothetical protein [Cyclobacteriaceae bacterium]
MFPALWSGFDMSSSVAFMLSKTIRLIANDCACLMLIWGWFREPSYLKAASWLFAVELFVILPLYLFVKLSLEGPTEISSPLLSQIHRLIVNPLLMFLLMVGFAVQQLRHPKH